MRRLARLIPIACLVFQAGCDGYASVSGYVVDGDGTPIEGATISMIHEGHAVGIGAVSAADGYFAENGCHAPIHSRIEFWVQKESFKAHRRHLPANDVDHNMRIVLERDRPVSQDSVENVQP